MEVQGVSAGRRQADETVHGTRHRVATMVSCVATMVSRVATLVSYVVFSGLGAKTFRGSDLEGEVEEIGFEPETWGFLGFISPCCDICGLQTSRVYK
jgi:hypothetical protein